MEARVADPSLADVDRLHFHFALGKAYEDAGDWAPSFEHYAKGNALRRAQVGYDAERNTQRMQRLKATLTREFFEARAGFGSPSPDPIFIVGLPRSGSTLIEQILSSHSEVEGTMELPEIISMARDLRGEVGLAGGRRLHRRARHAGRRAAARARRAVHRADAHLPQDRTDRTSSTRCRTTSCTSA